MPPTSDGRTGTDGAARFFASSRVVIVAGKGGVGKTTVTAALALAAARVGLAPLVVELEGKSGLASMFGVDDLDYAEAELAAADPEAGTGAVQARTLTPDEALIEYLNDNGLKRLSKRLVSSGVVDMVSTAVPGLRDIIVLGKVKQIEQTMRKGDGDDAPDVVIIDAPAAGHAITFLRSAHGLVDAVRVGPIRAQALDVQAMLTDATRVQVVLVTLPEETPVNELVETAYSLEDEVGVSLGPVVVNGLYPEIDGLDVCRALRKESDVPIIMLTARVEETDRLIGLELGADDYVTKPFSPREVVARVRAVLRRAHDGADSAVEEVVQVGDLSLDVSRRALTVAGQRVELTPSEFEILRVMMRSPGRVFTRGQLLEAAQGEAYEGYERTIDTHIKNLRQKIERVPRRPEYLLTVHGVGYRLRDE